MELAAYAGIVPFILCLLGMALLPSYEWRLLSQQIALAYGAVLLAGAGAVHVGLALGGRLAWRPQRLLGATLPALCGATAVILGGQRGLGLLVVGFGLFWLYEHRGLGDELPQNYLTLRRNLSVAGCLLLALTMFLSDYAGLV